MRYAPTVFGLIVGWGGDFFASSLTWRAYALAPPTPIRLIHGWGGDFFALSLTWRAYAIRPYIFWLNHWVGRLLLCVFAAMEGVCDTPLQILSKWIGDEQKLRKVLFN